MSGTGLSIVATHVDSPNLRIRPVSKKQSVGYMQVRRSIFRITKTNLSIDHLRARSESKHMAAGSGIHGTLVSGLEAHCLTRL